MPQLHVDYDFTAELYLLLPMGNSKMRTIFNVKYGYGTFRTQFRYAPGDGNTWTCEIFLLSEDQLTSGELKEVHMNIIEPHVHIDALHEKTLFQLEEGGCVIATGRILKFLEYYENVERYLENERLNQQK